MVQHEDLRKIQSLEEDTYKPDKPTLLSKFQIPIHHLDFSYVNKCDDVKEIEKIYRILKSGEEGFYPELQKVTEDKLRKLKPNSKYLREVCPVLKKNEISKEEWDHLSNDLSDWMEDAQNKDTELNAAKTLQVDCNVEVRQIKDDYKPVIQTSAKRIASTDYESWDKYDPDTEILKMDLEVEREKNEALEKQAKLKQAKVVRFSNFATEAEAIYEANSEKERGNECFKAGEFKNALHHYNQSIQCKRTAVGFTNRAITYIKMHKYDLAIKDCKTALQLDPKWFKAHLRLAQSYEAIKQYDAALKHITTAIEIDPNNVMAQDIANRLYKTSDLAGCGQSVNKTRLTIEDVESNKMKSLKPILKSPQQNLGKEVISIPGSSSMPPPFYVEVSNTDPELVKKEKQKIFSKPQILHMSTIDPPSDEERDMILKSQTEMELPKRCSTLHLDKVEETQLKDEYIFEETENLNLKECNDNSLKDSSRATENDQDIAEPTAGNTLQESTTNKKITKSDITSQVQCSNTEDGGGEPHSRDNSEFTLTEEDLQSPYMFTKMWNSAKIDISYTRQAEILRKIDFERIHEVIGYNLDEEMLSIMIRCLHQHFMVPSELDRVRLALSSFNRIPRFQMMLLFLSEYDRRCIKQLMEFLDQHERNLENNVKNVYNN